MLLDAQNLFSDAQKITTTAVSTNVVCLAKGLLKEMAFGTPIPFIAQVVEKFEGATSVKLVVETCDDTEFNEAETLVETGVIPVAELVDGYKFPVAYVPKGNKGYIRTKYVVDGTATAGAITAGFVAAHDNSYQDM